MSLLTSRFLQIARAEIGVREIGSSNRGSRVDEYQRADTLAGVGYAWCASLTAWLLKETSAAFAIEIPWTYSASCDVVWADAKKRKLIRSTPQPGDIFLVRAKRADGTYSTGDAIHTGVVLSVSSDGKTFTTIEGNSNSSGSREGHSVVSNRREVSPRFVFVGWVDGVRDFNVGQFASKEAPRTWAVVLQRTDGQKRTISQLSYDGRPFVSVRDFGEFYDLIVGWNQANFQASLDGVEVPCQVRFSGNSAIYPVRVLAELSRYAVYVDDATRTVTVKPESLNAQVS